MPADTSTELSLGLWRPHPTSSGKTCSFRTEENQASGTAGDRRATHQGLWSLAWTCCLTAVGGAGGGGVSSREGQRKSDSLTEGTQNELTEVCEAWDIWGPLMRTATCK